MRFITLLPILLILPKIILGMLPTTNQSLSLDSDYVEYKEKSISLSGNVTIEHDLGTIFAKSVELIPEKDNPKNPYLFFLEGDVKLTLKEGGGILSCAKAEINPASKVGHFQNSPEQEFVIYTEKHLDKSGELLPLQVKSHHMTVLMEDSSAKMLSKELPSRTIIKTIEAIGNVCVSYNNDFLALAVRATYEHLGAVGDTKSSLPGLITLYSKEGSSDSCKVTNKQGDLITADQISIDTSKRQIHLKNPQGILNSKGAVGLSSHPISFSSETLVWDDALNSLTLKNQICIQQSALGTITTEEQVQLFQQKVQDVVELRSIEAKGKTILSYLSSDGVTHHLTCYGNTLVDHAHYKTVMSSPIDDAGNILKGKQVCLKDDLGEIYANNLTIHYHFLEQKLIPVKIILEGDVAILNHGAIDREKTKVFLEYAIADLVEYQPKEHEVLMSALGKKRVLFFDRINNLQVSAPALKIRRDTQTNKDAIQGIGDVRFSFVKKEIEEIEKQFHLILNDKAEKKSLPHE